MKRPTRSLNQLLEDQVARWRAEGKESEQHAPSPAVPQPLITLSRQPGAGGLEVARGWRLA